MVDSLSLSSKKVPVRPPGPVSHSDALTEEEVCVKSVQFSVKLFIEFSI